MLPAPDRQPSGDEYPLALYISPLPVQVRSGFAAADDNNNPYTTCTYALILFNITVVVVVVVQHQHHYTERLST